MDGTPITSVLDPTGEILSLDPFPACVIDPAVIRYVNLVALTLKEPQEIWYEWTNVPIAEVETKFVMDATGVVRRYLSRFEIAGELIAITVITTTGPGGWIPREVVVGQDALDAARRGWIAYQGE